MAGKTTTKTVATTTTATTKTTTTSRRLPPPPQSSENVTACASTTLVGGETCVIKRNKSHYVHNPSTSLVVDCIKDVLGGYASTFQTESEVACLLLATGSTGKSCSLQTKFKNLQHKKSGLHGSKRNKGDDAVPTWVLVPTITTAGSRKTEPLWSKLRLQVCRTVPSSNFYRASGGGHTVRMQLLAVPDLLEGQRQRGEEAHESPVLKECSKLWYQLLGKIIRTCEWPKFPGTGMVFKNVYRLNEEIKAGAFGAVCRGEHRDSGEPYAIKIVTRSRLSPPDEIEMLTEVSIMSDISHPHIVRLVDFFETERYFILVMELCEGGDLFDRIGKKQKYNEEDARDLCKTLLEAARYCHDEIGVAHRDFKPHNLLLKDPDDDTFIKIADFGLASRVVSPASLTKQCGSPFFIAPEILRKQPYDQSADMWSLGVIIYVLLGGTCPFLGRNKTELFKSIVKGKYEFKEKYWANVSDEAKDLIRNLLVVDPEERLTARQALNSRWIREAEGEMLSSHDLSSSSRELKTFNARLKLKAAIIGARFVSFHRKSSRRKSSFTDDDADGGGDFDGVEDMEE